MEEIIYQNSTMVLNHDFGTFSQQTVMLVDNNVPVVSSSMFVVSPHSVNEESGFYFSRKGVTILPDILPTSKEKWDEFFTIGIKNAPVFTMCIFKQSRTMDGFSEYLLVSPSHNSIMQLRANVLYKNSNSTRADLQYCGWYFVFSSLGVNLIPSTKDVPIQESLRTFKQFELR